MDKNKLQLTLIAILTFFVVLLGFIVLNPSPEQQLRKKQEAATRAYLAGGNWEKAFESGRYTSEQEAKDKKKQKEREKELEKRLKETRERILSEENTSAGDGKGIEFLK